MTSVPASSGSRDSAAGSEQASAGSLDLAQQLRRGWETGRRPGAEEFLRLRPELAQDPEAAVELVYEEYCQREAVGDSRVEQDILARFPQWAGPLRVMIECHRHVIQEQASPPRFPQAGQCIGEFHLLEEIASGASGRVFRAVQSQLADRPVILKITQLDGGEHLSLARLQHTNIVPLYSVLDLPERNLRVLCMPYFGLATLAVALGSMSQVPVEARTGGHLLEAIDRVQRDPVLAEPDSGPRQVLAQASYVQAICWITASLADALHFAHERGLVHLDLKPSNILLAADGQPMLLDFHLAREPLRPDGPPPENLGGTPAYMSPEQRLAIDALRQGQPAQVAVDGRADVYALGAILHECLSGGLARDRNTPLERCKSQVSRGLSDVVAKCLLPQPQDRYPTAAALAEDLRRHLMHRPLAGVANRSLAERWSKWRLRRPSALRSAAMLATLALALLIVAGAILQNARQARRQAGVALRDGQRQIGHGQFAEAVESFARGSSLARQSLFFPQETKRELDQQLETARRRHLVQQTHELAEQVRRLPGIDAVPATHLSSLSSRCRELWNRRTALLQGDGTAQDAQLELAMKDIALFAAVLGARSAEEGEEGEARLLDAIRTIDEAQATFGDSAVLDYERRRFRLQLGQPVEQLRGLEGVAMSSWEHWALGRAMLDDGDLRGAMEQLAIARALEPAGIWANYYYALCAFRLGEFQEAVTAFSVCIGAESDFADFYFNRGLAYAALGRRYDAIQDYRRALALEPDHPARELLVALDEPAP